MKKPSIPTVNEPTSQWTQNVSLMLQLFAGQGGIRIQPAREVKLIAAAAPTKAEYDALAVQVVLLQKKVNELVDLLHGQ